MLPSHKRIDRGLPRFWKVDGFLGSNAGGFLEHRLRVGGTQSIFSPFDSANRAKSLPALVEYGLNTDHSLY